MPRSTVWRNCAIKVGSVLLSYLDEYDTSTRRKRVNYEIGLTRSRFVLVFLVVIFFSCLRFGLVVRMPLG
jgi:hypothetical protein